MNKSVQKEINPFGKKHISSNPVGISLLKFNMETPE